MKEISGLQPEDSVFILDRKQQGAMGYISRTAIDAILNGEETDLSDAVFVYELAPGEGAENGIAASKDGAVIPDESELLSASGRQWSEENLGNSL